MVLSGLLLQIGFHMGQHGNINTTRLVLGLTHSNWADLHLISILFVSLSMVFHIISHWKWYRTVIPKRPLFIKNQQTIILTLLFLSVAATGDISWVIKLKGGVEISRKFFMEIHDKITWILLIYLIFHITKRFKWYSITFKQIMKFRRLLK
jgi:hypothetical protein